MKIKHEAIDIDEQLLKYIKDEQKNRLKKMINI
jgi:hypothetical protein